MSTIDGRRAIVTGPTSGIGKEIARQLATFGAEVVLACRDVDRGKRTAREISAGTGTGPAVMAIDTSSQNSIRQFADDYRQRYGSLDVLVNNAGVLRPGREVSVDGYELTFATNVLGYHLLTRELVDALRASTFARVINVASVYASDVDLDDLQFERRPYDGMRAYAQSKACDRMLSWAFARRLQPDGVTVNAVAPGLVLETALYRDLPAEIRHYLEQQPSRTIAEGANSAVWLATNPDVASVTGRFYDQRTEVDCQFRDVDAEEKLWDLCQAMVNAPRRPSDALQLGSVPLGA
ncbi:SDR family NAD(P)-dependent oxidoreductase [Geodermatophilus chilensis]|uniref:SDR family NAD(P)-dependent oxidoreductase n=1 Tax=Geodermatophilus chilensis TaxID=2035835 RepID=UPI0012FFF2AC|nr:SDR family NAD(P)-dependent oxidoreductase [Geodermatophilus chilensis]